MAKKTLKIKTIKKKKSISSAAEKLLKGLNQQQITAVKKNKGPLLIIAGAGTGKTKTITHKVAYLIAQGVNPASILLVTFTKKAAEEMVARVKRLTGSKADLVKAGTFHHIANLVLHQYGNKIGLKNNFSILDQEDQKHLMKIALTNFVTDKKLRKKYPKPRQLCDIYSQQINLAKKLDWVIKNKFPEYSQLIPNIKKIIDSFNKMKKENNQMDFDGLMLYFLSFLQDKSASLSFKKKIKYVFVDEFQDVNAIQAKIVEELATNAESIAVVGDDAQAIYGFRGADFTHMRNFPKTYPNATKTKLEINYRSTPEILALANESIAHNKNQYQKVLKANRPSINEKPMVITCKNLEEEAETICELILQYRRDEEIPLHKQAILFRSSYHRLFIEKALIDYGIEYEVRAGVRFFEKAHIKDLLAMLIIIENPLDLVQWNRVLAFHDGITTLSAQKIIDTLNNQNNSTNGSNMLDAFIKSNLFNELKGKRIRKEGLQDLINLQNFYKKLLYNEESGNRKPENELPVVQDIINVCVKYLTPYIKKNYADKKPEDRIQDLNEMINLTAKYSTLTSFLNDIITQYNAEAEVIKKGDPEDQEKPLILSTIHQAKGLEWDVVFVVSMIDGRFPSSKVIANDEMEEERRLFYVAATRARDHLIFTYPLFIPNYNYQEYDVMPQRSLFLKEIADSNVFDEIDIKWDTDDDEIDDEENEISFL